MRDLTTEEAKNIGDYIDAISSDTGVSFFQSEQKDGVYIDVFVIKDGLRYRVRTLPISEVSKILTKGVLDALDEIIKGKNN